MSSGAGRFRAVSFDVGGTLIEPWPSVGHIYAEVAARYGVSAPAEELNRGFAVAWRARGDFGYTQAEWFALVRHTFGDRSVLLPEAFFPAVYRRFAEADAWRIHDDVLPVLDHLASRACRSPLSRTGTNGSTNCSPRSGSAPTSTP